MKNKILFSVMVLSMLTGCSAADFRKEIGIQKSPPDEFMVEPRQKLRVPETAVALPAPQKKVDGSLQASVSGREAIYGQISKDTRANSEAENALLSKAGAQDADPGIRRKVEKEYKSKEGVFGTKRGGTLEAILDPFGYNAPVDPVVDPKKENKRIKEALQKGEKIDPKKVEKTRPNKDAAEEEGVL